ncbi:MAG: twin-arginine translocase subunit TatC [Sulfuricurvum sp.]|uniref:twin-arginine translocase subunit TatC n=1 Tax=Sulfuricurvum sp. TaxID=2025608 RepID=UPI0026203F06|nr:twin-arginine translocase subunit TatC [Sulfuricurvum sp.]MDD2828538.1 twin-arginine translocase subunit TatC [Sulfuricurvum sp.]MDD4948931.1 twin-arginine translocase subunit TatC [Sulfuricurvum sp.]
MFDDLKPHIAELRKRLGISVAAIILLFFVMWNFHDAILAWITQPLITALTSVGKISPKAAQGMLVTKELSEAFFVAMKVSFFASIIAALPIILAQIWLFIAPGLYSNEKKMIIPIVIGGTVMFLVGGAFAYYLVTPLGFAFFIEFGSASFVPMYNISEYVEFFTKIIFGFGLAFELPVFCYFLALLGLIDDRMMIGFFRYAIVLIFIIAAILTPPDVLSQIMMALPLILLYGISILIVKAVNPAPKEEAYIEEDEEETID